MQCKGKEQLQRGHKEQNKAGFEEYWVALMWEACKIVGEIQRAVERDLSA